ncbi:hypothetical protein WJX77_010996 [Trebouxia sp. C0004]
MVTTRRGKTTAVAPPASSKAKGQSTGTEAVNDVDGSHAIAESNTQQQHKGKKRGIGLSDHAPPSELLKRQKKASSKAKADLQVKPAEPLLEEKAAVPEADTIAAAAAVDPPAGSKTAISAEDLTAATGEEPKLDVTHTSEMPVSEAVKNIGGTHAGIAPVSEAPTAGKALDSMPVRPDPAAAAPAADDTPQDGDYFLDATLADSKQGNEEAKPVEQVTQPKGTVAAFKTASAAQPVTATEDSMDNGQTGMAADVAPAASTDVPTGVHADKAAAAHLAKRTGTVVTTHEAIATAPTTVDTRDSHFDAAAGQDAADVPAAMYGGDNS